MRNKWLVNASMALLLCVGCGEKAGRSTESVSQPGWTQSRIKDLIACEPESSEECVCVVERVTNEYTPQQVEQKSPFVAKKMLEIQSECEPNPGAATKEPAYPFEYFFDGPGCDTGNHRFSEIHLMCDGLQDRAGNNDCASEARREKFEEHGCPGEFSES